MELLCFGGVFSYEGLLQTGFGFFDPLDSEITLLNLTDEFFV